MITLTVLLAARLKSRPPPVSFITILGFELLSVSVEDGASEMKPSPEDPEAQLNFPVVDDHWRAAEPEQFASPEPFTPPSNDADPSTSILPDIKTSEFAEREFPVAFVPNRE